MRQYAGVYLLQNYSTCFGCLSHPSTGVHQTVAAVQLEGRQFSWRVVEFRRVCCELLSKGRQCAVTCRITARGSVPRLGDSRGVACLGVMTLTEQLETAWH